MKKYTQIGLFEAKPKSQTPNEQNESWGIKKRYTLNGKGLKNYYANQRYEIEEELIDLTKKAESYLPPYEGKTLTEAKKAEIRDDIETIKRLQKERLELLNLENYATAGMLE